MAPEDRCSGHEGLEQCMRDVNKKLDVILQRLGEGDVTFGTLRLRVRILETVVYGAVGIALLSVAGKLLDSVVP